MLKSFTKRNTTHWCQSTSSSCLLVYLLKILAGGPPLTLGGAHITTSNVVRVLGVLLTPNLSLNKHVTSLSAKCFLPARRYASAGLCDSDVSVRLSVCLSVRHTPVLCLAERKQDREVYTVR